MSRETTAEKRLRSQIQSLACSGFSLERHEQILHSEIPIHAPEIGVIHTINNDECLVWAVARDVAVPRFAVVYVRADIPTDWTEQAVGVKDLVTHEALTAYKADGSAWISHDGFKPRLSFGWVATFEEVAA
jgi:hypothetical protein